MAEKKVAEHLRERVVEAGEKAGDAVQKTEFENPASGEPGKRTPEAKAKKKRRRRAQPLAQKIFSAKAGEKL